MDKFDKAVTASAKANDSGGFRGYAARFLNIDRQGDIILPGAFTKAVDEFMSDGGLVLADHVNKTSNVIGTLLEAQEDKTGLIVDVAFSATTAGQDARQLLREKAVKKMSIAFLAKKPERYTEKQVLELWSKYNYKPTQAQLKLAKGGANVISEVAEILEVSIVAIPANPEASIITVKSSDLNETPLSGETPQPDLAALFERAKAADWILLNSPLKR